MEKQEFVDKVRKIAGILGYTMTIPEESYQNQAILKMPNSDVTINIRTGGYQETKKIYISGSCPANCHGRHHIYNLKNPHIGCSQDKTPEQIARDIQRRFLPDYMEDLKQVLEANKKTQEYADTKNQTMKVLGDLLGIEPKKEHNNEYSLLIWDTLPGLDKIEVDYYGTRVDMKLELTPDQTVQVLTLMKTFEKAEA